MTGHRLGTAPPGTVLLNVRIPNYDYGGYWPHLVDIYVPATPYRRAWISLPGGSGTNKYQAKITRILYSTPAVPSNVNWDIMKLFQFMAVFPQGQACLTSNILETPSTPTTGNPASHNLWNPNGIDSSVATNPQLVNGVYTWSNGHHWSGYNDALFLLHLNKYLYLTYPAVSATHLHGQSDGAMMTLYMAANYPLGTMSAPLGFNTHLVTSGSIPIPSPSFGAGFAFGSVASSPVWLQYGRMDGVLGINGGIYGPGDHWNVTDYWSQQPDKISLANHDGTGYGMTGTGKFVPTIEHTKPGPIGFQSIVTGYNATHSLGAETYHYTDAVATTTASGDTLRTWTYSGGKNVMRLIENRIHKYTDQQASVGHPLLYDMFQWIGSLH